MNWGAPTGSSGQGNANVSVDKDLASGWDGSILGGVDVVTCGKGAPTRRQASLVRELLDLQWGRTVHGGNIRLGALRWW